MLFEETHLDPFQMMIKTETAQQVQSECGTSFVDMEFIIRATHPHPKKILYIRARR